MKAVMVSITFLAIIAVTTVVFAGTLFNMKCESKTCGFEAGVMFGGGMAFQQLTGYCQSCEKFVYLQWTRKGSPLVDPNAEIVEPPEPLGKILDLRTGSTLTIFACPDCKGPFAEIKSLEDLKHCPACNKPEFAIDESKPTIVFD